MGHAHSDTRVFRARIVHPINKAKNIPIAFVVSQTTSIWHRSGYLSESKDPEITL